MMNFSGVQILSEDAQYNGSGNVFPNGSDSASGPISPLSSAEIIEQFIYSKMIVAVCFFGIGGNLLNLIILSQKSLMCAMKRMEKSAHYGLLLLAVSDLLVCLTALPAGFYATGNSNGGFAHDSFDFRLVYKLYGHGMVNALMLSSTWLTVTMAVSRYIAVCHPLRARQIIGKTFTVVSLVAATLGSVLFNVPRFFRYEPRSIITGGRRMYFAHPGPLENHPGVSRAYSWSYFTLGIAVPLSVLVFSNTKLVLALRSSRKLRACTSMWSTYHRTSTDHDLDHHGNRSSRRITLTLIIIIVLFVVLFVPPELLNFFAERAVGDAYHTDIFNVAQAVGNLLQAVNFAVNFVLYCVVNTHFRQTVYRLVQSSCCRGGRPLSNDSTYHPGRIRRQVDCSEPEHMDLCIRHVTERPDTSITSAMSLSSLPRSRMSTTRLIFSI